MDGFGRGVGGGGRGGEKKKILRRNYPPWRQCILQERSEFMENMGAKRCSKMKVDQAAFKAAAAALEGNYKLLIRNEVVV